jgi:hypothetical protein
LEEIVLCQDISLKGAHQELFNFSDSSYLVINDLRKEILGLNEIKKPLKVHLCVNWHGLLEVILWTDKPASSFVLRVLKNAGIDEKEIKEFKDTDTLTFFHWLYYGRRFKILRKLCYMAKNIVQEKVRGVRFELHLIAEENSRIVASTL